MGSGKDGRMHCCFIDGHAVMSESAPPDSIAFHVGLLTVLRLWQGAVQALCTAGAGTCIALGMCSSACAAQNIQAGSGVFTPCAMPLAVLCCLCLCCP